VVSLLQSKLQMDVFEVGSDAMLQPACAERRLVINSHVEYGKALDRLLASLKEHSFPLKDCVVIRGGALKEKGPHIGSDGVTFVDLALNSFDLNALAGLSRYKNHSLVCADMYFLIHDSAQIGPCFPQAFKEIKVSPTEVITPGFSFFSNQCVFGRSVVDNFGDDFEKAVGKVDALVIEGGQCIGKACSIDHYALSRTILPPGEELGDLDVYKTSKPREVRWYKAWDLYKFVSPQDKWQISANGDYKHDLSLLQQQWVRVSHQTASDPVSAWQDHHPSVRLSEDMEAYRQGYASSCSRKCMVKDIQSNSKSA